MMEESFFLVKNVNKTFGKRRVLKNINFSIQKGEFVSLVGVSGSGKSTLLNIIAGLEKPDEGNVFLDGKDILNKTGNVSYMFQKDLLFPYYTILENVILPLVIQGKDKDKSRQKAIPLFKDFGLEGCQNQYPSQLSGGMKQRAALLRTYLFSKELMLLDEPFSALDMITKNPMHEWYLSTIEKLGLTPLLIHARYRRSSFAFGQNPYNEKCLRHRKQQYCKRNKGRLSSSTYNRFLLYKGIS